MILLTLSGEDILSPDKVKSIIYKDDDTSVTRRPLYELEIALRSINRQLAIPHEFYTLGYVTHAQAFTSMRKAALHERIRYYQARIKSLQNLRDDGAARFQDSITYLHDRIYTLQKASIVLDHLLALHIRTEEI